MDEESGLTDGFWSSDWGTFLSATGQGIVGAQAARLITPVSTAPVAKTNNGWQYEEGKPAKNPPQGGSMDGRTLMIIGAALVVGYLLMRKA